MGKIEICKRRGDCEQRGHARSIVGNAGTVKLAALLPDIERSVCRKNRIQMGADGNDSPRDTRIAAEDVANGIFMNLTQAEGPKAFGQPVGPRRFAKRRCRNAG